MPRKIFFMVSICLFLFSVTNVARASFNYINMDDVSLEALNIDKLETFSHNGKKFTLDKGTQVIINEITKKSNTYDSNQETVKGLMSALDEVIQGRGFKNRYAAQQRRMLNAKGLKRLKIAIICLYQLDMLEKYIKNGKDASNMQKEKIEYVVLHMLLFRPHHFVKSCVEKQSQDYYLDLFSVYYNIF